MTGTFEEATKACVDATLKKMADDLAKDLEFQEFKEKFDKKLEELLNG